MWVFFFLILVLVLTNNGFFNNYDLILVKPELIAICRVTMVTNILLLMPLILLRLTVNPKGSLAVIQK